MKGRGGWWLVDLAVATALAGFLLLPLLAEWAAISARRRELLAGARLSSALAKLVRSARVAGGVLHLGGGAGPTLRRGVPVGGTPFELPPAPGVERAGGVRGRVWWVTSSAGDWIVVELRQGRVRRWLRRPLAATAAWRSWSSWSPSPSVPRS